MSSVSRPNALKLTKEGFSLTYLERREFKCIPFAMVFNYGIRNEIIKYLGCTKTEEKEFLKRNIIPKDIYVHLNKIKKSHAIVDLIYYYSYAAFVYVKDLPPEYEIIDGNLVFKGLEKYQTHEPIGLFWSKRFNEFPYSIAEWSRAVKSRLKEEFEKHKTPKEDDFIKLGSMLVSNSYSVGLEFETSSNWTLPENLAKTYTLPLTDGSLRRDDKFSPEEYRFTPVELTTLPIFQPNDLIKVLHSVDKYYKKDFKYNHKCSLHLHFGNQPLEKDFTIALFILAQTIQDEILTYFPYYKTDHRIHSDISKNYCQKLPSLRELNLKDPSLYKKNNKVDFHHSLITTFRKLYYFLSGGYELSLDYNIGNIDKGILVHPAGENKWNHNRYYWINFINYAFNSSRTIELRISPMTFDKHKIMGLLLLFYSMFEYTRKYKRQLITKQYYPVKVNDLFEVLPKVF